MKRDNNSNVNFAKYLVLGIVFWVIVDFTTVFIPSFQSWFSHMPLIWVFYIGYPLVFSYLIYKKKWNNKSIFYAMIAGIIIVELVFTNNTLLYTFPILLLAIPLSFFIYSLITFVPKWLTESSIKQNWKMTLLLIIVWIIVSGITYITNMG